MLTLKSTLLCSMLLELVPAFVPTITNLPLTKPLISGMLHVRPEPKAAFDLASIEAYENELDKAIFLPSNRTVDKPTDAEVKASVDDIKTFTVSPALNNKRLDAALALLDPSVSRSNCGKLVTDGCVQVSIEGKLEIVDRKSFKVSTGDEIRVDAHKPEEITEIISQDLPLNIIFEDEHMIVLNKAAGMVVHPAAGNWDGTVVNALAYYLPNSAYGSGDIVEESDDDSTAEKDGEKGEIEDGDNVAPFFRPGIVHRLDKGTTGILVVAKTSEALSKLSASFAERKVKKTYLVITVGNPGKRVVIDKPIGRHPVHRQKMRVVPDHGVHSNIKTRGRRVLVGDLTLSQAGRRALSFVDTQAFDGKLSLVQVRIETGRTHQIRVHLSDRQTPVYGDDVYGLSDWNKRLAKVHRIDRPLLHAWRLEIDHPITGKPLAFEAPLAPDMHRISNAIWPDGKSERPDIFQL